MRRSINKEYKTMDFRIACCLRSFKVYPERMEKVDGKKVRFVFLEDEKFNWALELIQSGKAKVDPMILFSSISSVKSSVIDFLNNN